MSLGGNLTLFIIILFFSLENVNVPKTSLYLDVGGWGIQSCLEFLHTFLTNECHCGIRRCRILPNERSWMFYAPELCHLLTLSCKGREVTLCFTFKT